MTAAAATLDADETQGSSFAAASATAAAVTAKKETGGVEAEKVAAPGTWK